MRAVDMAGQLAKTMPTADGAARRPAPADLVPPADGPAAWRRERTPYRAAHGARKREEGHALVEEICRLVAVFVATGAWPACHRRPEFQYNFNFFLIGAYHRIRATRTTLRALHIVHTAHCILCIVIHTPPLPSETNFVLSLCVFWAFGTVPQSDSL